MITQSFLTEFEVSLLKAYARASRSTILSGSGAHASVEVARFSERFASAFMSTFKERRAAIEAEIGRGGHRNPPALADKLERIVEGKLRAYLFHQGNKVDENSFRKVVRDIKSEIRSIFYEPSS